MELKPEFLKLKEAIDYDHSVERTSIEQIPCSKTDIVSLNQANSQLKFVNKGNFLYRLASPNSYFEIAYEFRTRDVGGPNREANITLSNNFAMHLFSEARLTLGNRIVEFIRYLGNSIDMLNHTEEEEFRNSAGQLTSFIPDTSNLASDQNGVRLGNIAGVDAAAIVASVNNANQRNIEYNENFNYGFVKRKILYNYEVANNNDSRFGGVIVPLNRVFGFADEIDKALQYIGFDIELVRSSNDSRCFFGAVGTSIDNFRVTSVMLNLEIIYPQANLIKEIQLNLAEKLEYAFLKRTCLEKNCQNLQSITQSYEMSTEDGNPRYVLLGFKSNTPDTYETNYGRFVNGDVQSVQVRYSGNCYPSTSQNADFSRNNFGVFYKEFIDVCRCLGFRNPALSMSEYRDRYTIFAVNLSSMPKSAIPGSLVIEVKRRNIPPDNAILQNPQEVTLYTLILSEAKIIIEPVNSIARF